MTIDEIQTSRPRKTAADIRAYIKRYRELAPRQRVIPRVFYGYTPDAKMGGPYLKVRRLAEHFPPCEERFNLMYSVNGLWPEYDVCKQMKELRVPLVFNANGVYYRGWYGPGWERENERLRRLYQLADYILFQSRFSRLSAETFLGPPLCPHEVLYNAVDVSRFRPVAHPRADDTPLVLLTAGSHVAPYRLEVPVRALALIRRSQPDARLLIAGTIPPEHKAEERLHRLNELIAALGLQAHVTVLPPYSPAEAPRVYQRASMLVHTQYNDVCPTTVLEAMACGLPVVYSTSGGTPELVGAEAGVGIPAPLDWEAVHPPAPEAVAEAILAAAARRTMMSRAARERAVAHFDVQPWIRRHRQVFARVLRRSRYCPWF